MFSAGLFTPAADGSRWDVSTPHAWRLEERAARERVPVTDRHLLFALIHSGSSLPEWVDGDNRQHFLVVWRFCPIAKSVGVHVQVLTIDTAVRPPELAVGFGAAHSAG